MLHFSVIIPNYNHAPFLRERINSILNQTFQDFELIILDDASTDNSKEIFEQYKTNPKITHIVYNNTNSGLQSTQWLKGIELVKHDWIWIAESDDIAAPSFLQTAANRISKIPGPAIIYTDSLKLTENNKRYSEIKNSFFDTDKWSADYTAKGEDEINSYIKYGCTINNVSAAVFPKKQAIEILKNFLHMRYYSDWLFFIQLLQRCEIIYVAEPLNWYRMHEGSLFNSIQDPFTKRKECFSILNYLVQLPFLSGKEELVKFFTEQYLSFGLWNERKYLSAIFKNYRYINQPLFYKFLKYFTLLKIGRKKIKYIF